jgi:hypothetical protein
VERGAMTITAKDILNALIIQSDDKIWASELALEGLSRRIDFWTLEPARSRGWRAVAYEIKVSRQDFGRDSEKKQEAALNVSDRFWYVTPPGLMEFDGTEIRIRKRAPRREKREPDWDFIVSLMRNCGDARRDIGLMKAQLAFHVHREAMLKEREKMRTDFGWRRLLERRGHAGKAVAT